MMATWAGHARNFMAFSAVVLICLLYARESLSIMPVCVAIVPLGLSFRSLLRYWRAL